jgi:hypothetical protein
MKVAVWQLAMLSKESQLNIEQSKAKHTNEEIFLTISYLI